MSSSPIEGGSIGCGRPPRDGRHCVQFEVLRFGRSTCGPADSVFGQSEPGVTILGWMGVVRGSGLQPGRGTL
jgi:hypothetical protein